jgi:hypothetical protein
VQIETKDISLQDGSDLNPVITRAANLTVSNETLTVSLGNVNKFTTIEFTRAADAE